MVLDFNGFKLFSSGVTLEPCLISCLWICFLKNATPWQVRTRILNSFSGLPDCSVGGPVGDFFESTLATNRGNMLQHGCLIVA